MPRKRKPKFKILKCIFCGEPVWLIAAPSEDGKWVGNIECVSTKVTRGNKGMAIECGVSGPTVTAGSERSVQIFAFRAYLRTLKSSPKGVQ